jgi:ribosomal protein S24E
VAMKKILMLLFTLNSAFMLQAQDSWKVYHNKSELKNIEEENESKNIISINSSSLNKEGEFVLTYFEKEPQKDWSRFMAVFDNQDNELLQRKNLRMLKVSNATLKDLFKKSSTLHIYSWSLPNDPDLAARIRIRRVHLCTIELK